MVGKVYSVTLTGLEGTVVLVEADVSDGLPGFEIVGIPGSEVKEARERVRSSFRNNNYFFPPKKITINLSPADIRKKGCGFDLAIAISVLSAMDWFPSSTVTTVLSDSIFCGELSLDGNVCSVPGILSSVICARENGFKRCFVPLSNAEEASCIEGVDIIGINRLSDLIYILNHPQKIGDLRITTTEYSPGDNTCTDDFSEVNGQKLAKRVLEIAAAGMHNVMLMGPPGSGKSMLAKRVPSILPPLAYEESIELTRIYSISGHMEAGNGMVKARPFRAPHHTCTNSSMIGGGLYPSPGEISLADRGVLFLDELPEFRRSVLESLRQPLEDKKVIVPRLSGVYEFPANTMIIAAMNRCKCGYYPDLSKCKCTISEVRQYRNRISGPLLDRIDLCTEVMPLSSKELFDRSRQNESSSAIRERVMKCHRIEQERFKGTGIYFNSQMNSSLTEKFCPLSKKAEKKLRNYLDHFEVSTRGYYKILKTARTIADLAGSSEIQENHLTESILYKTSNILDIEKF